MCVSITEGTVLPGSAGSSEICQPCVLLLVPYALLFSDKSFTLHKDSLPTACCTASASLRLPICDHMGVLSEKARHATDFTVSMDIFISWGLLGGRKNRLGSWLRDLIACELLQNCPEPIRRKSVQRNSVKKKVSLGFWCICLNSKVKMVFVCDLPKKSINVSAVIHSHASSTLFFFFLAIPVQPVGSFPNQESNPCPSYSRRVES